MSSIMHLRELLSCMVARVDSVQSRTRQLLAMESVLPFQAMYEQWRREYEIEDFDDLDFSSNTNLDAGDELESLMENKQIIRCCSVLNWAFDFTYSTYRLEKIADDVVVSDKLRNICSDHSPWEPSKEGWFPEEYNVVESFYKDEISRLAEWLRYIGTDLDYIEREKASIPTEYKGICGLGELPLQRDIPDYDEKDFYDYARSAALQGDSFTKHAVPLLSLKWQWLLFGEKAQEALDHFKVIRMELQPQENEFEIIKALINKENNATSVNELNPNQRSRDGLEPGTTFSL